MPLMVCTGPALDLVQCKSQLNSAGQRTIWIPEQMLDCGPISLDREEVFQGRREGGGRCGRERTEKDGSRPCCYNPINLPVQETQHGPPQTCTHWLVGADPSRSIRATWRLHGIRGHMLSQVAPVLIPCPVGCGGSYLSAAAALCTAKHSWVGYFQN